MKTRWHKQWLWALVAVGLWGASAMAQHVPGVKGSLDAITVIPGPDATQPATTTTAPAGHGGTGVMPTGIPGHPQKMQTPKTGALRVIVSQGTKGAPALGKDKVRIELLVKGVVSKTYNAALDEKGMVEIRDLPLDPPFQPIITVIHNGAEEQMTGPPMHRYQPAIELEMQVFETTAEKPEWTIGMRHAVAVPVKVDDRLMLHVTEMIGGFNPMDRAWLGETVDGSLQTMAISLPAGAEHVQMGPGFAEAGAKVVGGKIVRGKTMLPGSREYIFGYEIPVVDGKAALEFVAPAPITLFALYVPGGTTIDAKDGLEAGKPGGTHSDAERQLLKAHGLKVGQVVTVRLSGIKPPVIVKPVEPVEQTSELNLPVPKPKTTQPGKESK